MRTALISAALVVAIVAGAAIAVPALLDARALMKPMEARAAQAGLSMSMSEPRIQVLWRPALELDHLTLRDAEGEPVVTAAAVEAELDLASLLMGRTRFAMVRIADAEMPLDAARLAQLEGLAPAGTKKIAIANGVFAGADGREIAVRDLQLNRGSKGGADLTGFVGADRGLRIDAAVDPADAEGMHRASLSVWAAEDDGDTPRLALEARLGSTGEGWLVADAGVALPGLRLTGEGVVRTGERWHASLGLRAQEGTLDALPTDGTVGAIDVLSQLGRLELLVRLGAATWRGGTVRDAQLDVAAERGRADFVTAVATLPGQTTLSLSGEATPIAGPDAALEGTVLADTADPVAFLAWLGAPAPWAEGAEPDHAVLDAGYRFDAGALRFDPMTVRWTGTTIKGDLSLGRGEPGLEAALEADTLDLHAFERPAWLLPTVLGRFDVDLGVRALSMGDEPLGPARLRARSDGTRIDIETLALPDLGGLDLSVEGAIDGLPDAPAFDLRYAASGEVDAVWAAAGIAPPPWMYTGGGAGLRGTAVGALSGATVEAEGHYGDLPFTARGRAGVTADGPSYALDVTAKRAEGLSVNLPLTINGNGEEMELTATEGVVGGVPIDGRMTLGLGDGPVPVDFELRSLVAPLLARIDADIQATGALEAQFAGTGDPRMASLAEGLEGSGVVTVRDGTIDGFDVAALDNAVAGTDGPTGLINLVAQLGGEGVTRFSRVDIPFTLRGGRADIQGATLDANGANATASGVVELPTRRVDLHTRMALDSAKEAPPIALDIRGQWDSLRARLDFNALQRYLLGDGQ